MTEIMTRQEAFTKAYKGLESQGFEPATSSSPVILCAYRGEKGRRCAFGWLIPNYMYESTMEGMSSRDFGNTFYERCGLNWNDRNFFIQLQQAHDRAYAASKDPAALKTAPEYMKENLRNLANKYQLEIPA